MAQANRWIQHSAERVDEDTRSLRPNIWEVPLVKIFDRPHGPPQKIDLEFMSKLPQVAQILADSFWIEMASMSDMTRSTRRVNLKTLFTFLQVNERNKVKSLQDFTFELLGAFAKWLTDEKGLSGLSAQHVYHSVTQLLRVARRLHPNEFRPDFEIPSYGLSPQDRRSSKGLAPEIFAEIIRTATREVSAIQEGYSPGDFPTRGRDLIPFMILIATYTAMNPFSLYQLGRNCLEPHPIDNNGVY